MASLGRVALLGCGRRPSPTAAARIAAEANAGLRSAGEESRFPPRRLARRLLPTSDARAIAARLGSGGAPFVAALDTLEQAGNVAGGSRAKAPRAPRRWGPPSRPLAAGSSPPGSR